MKRGSSFAILAALFSAAVAAAADQQPAQLSPADTARIKVEIIDAMKNYVKVFSARDAKDVVGKVYNHPTIAFGPNGATVVNSEKQIAAFEGVFKNLDAVNWGRSEYPNPNVCVLNENVAIASGRFYRYKKNGSLLSEGGSSYIFVRTNEGWKIVTAIGHAISKVVTCTD